MRASPVALHTAARRYLAERYERWTTRYAEIGGSPSDGYTAQELDTFPRYNVLAAILAAVERLTPTHWTSLEEAREHLAEAARSAESPFTRPPFGTIEGRAMAEEREEFIRFVHALNERELAAVAPLPYRRVLSEQAFRALRRQLETVWGIGDGYWYPLAESVRPDVVAFQAPYFRRSLCPDRLQAMLQQRGVARLWELREHGPSYEIELSEFDPSYTGAEGFWSSDELEWVVYASHESSITVGGDALIAAIQQAWPEWQQYIWTTPFF